MIDLSKLEDVEVADIDTNDYPDFCDAFIESASYQGKELDEEQLEYVNSNRDFVYEQVLKRLY